MDYRRWTTVYVYYIYIYIHTVYMCVCKVNGRLNFQSIFLPELNSCGFLRLCFQASVGPFSHWSEPNQSSLFPADNSCHGSTPGGPLQRGPGNIRKKKKASRTFGAFCPAGRAWMRALECGWCVGMHVTRLDHDRTHITRSTELLSIFPTGGCFCLFSDFWKLRTYKRVRR